MTRLGVFGGVYANPHALRAVLDACTRLGCDRLLCLGDLGGFGAECDAVWPLLLEHDVECIAGNYDVAIGRGDDDCGCGYTSERDNHFAQATYDYTRAHTGTVFAAWMRGLAKERRFTTEGCDILCVHGSPLVISDFLWESLDDDELLGRLDAIAPTRPDVLLGTHTGLPWSRRVGGTLLVNVGAIGRPANDGRTDVWFAVVDCQNGAASARLEPLAYDWRAQAASMRAVGLPEPFVETIETGWDDVPGDRAAGRARPRALPRLSRAAADGLRAGRRWVD